MSELQIQRYLNHLHELRRVSGTSRESVVSEAFKDLLKECGREHDLTFVPQHEFRTARGERRVVDGALFHALRVPFGYWEAKDEHDDLDAEIATKLRRGYPQDNIIFEDSRTAVLFQRGQEVMRCSVEEVRALDRLLKLYFSYERAEISEFRRAVEQFKHDLPDILQALRTMIDQEYDRSEQFRGALDRFLKHARAAISPALAEADVREMLIQHILTEDIFSRVFGEDDFHRSNNIARQLYALEAVFFTGSVKKRTLRGLEPYYSTIRSTAARIASHHDKQAFLRAIYENFYRVYNPKAADRLGVVYTPGEIVRFMIAGADWLCEKHFGRHLVDRDVEILDPAAGTGTFVCELIEYFRGQPSKLRRKYLEEIHANEVGILPYYTANLNIESTYAAMTGEYLEYPNLCFVDTLDNVGRHTAQRGVNLELFAGLSEENVARIKRQNARRISVILGNPPYNANQVSENDNNKNRTYPEVDERIKRTYIEQSTAQKTKLYDMYARFFRWCSDRLATNGILAFVTNRSFIDSRTFDGFRKCVHDEFNEIYVFDLGGDVRENPRLSGTRHNVFGIQTGVAISFMVKRERATGCQVLYARRPELETAEEKLRFLRGNALQTIEFDKIRPDPRNNWFSQISEEFEGFLPLAAKATKAAKSPRQERAIFKQFSFGVVTNRDDWVYGKTRGEVERKVRHLISTYNGAVRRVGKREADAAAITGAEIKWTRSVKRDLAKGVRYTFKPERIIRAMYRPYVEEYLYFSPQLNEMPNLMPRFFGEDGRAENLAIVITDPTSQKPFMALAVNQCPDMHIVGAAAGGVVLPLLRLEEEGPSAENVTDWALNQFKRRYTAKRGGRRGRDLTKVAIFHYVYAVMHDPLYREQFLQSLKEELPRVPFYPDFWYWSDRGKELMNLHVGFRTASPFGLRCVEQPSDEKEPRVVLKADKSGGRMILDSRTSLTGVPESAWRYQLGGRSALEWILDQYKEKAPRDPTVREKFSTYRLANHKAEVIDLLCRVTTVSVETVRIVEQLRDAERS